MNIIKNIFCFKFVFIAVLFLFFGLNRVYAAVVINEIYPKPEDPKFQWIELYNTGDESVSMNQWTLKNSNGEQKTFILNASARFEGRGYYVIPNTQSGIILSKDGDTITLTDDRGTSIDAQSFPGTLGFNNAYGRSPDGGAFMTVCIAATEGAANNCPAPTPSPSASPTPILTSPPVETPFLTPTYAPTESGQVSLVTNNPSDESIPRIIQPKSVLGAVNSNNLTNTPTLSPDMVQIVIPSTFVISKIMIFQILAVLGAWGLLAIVAHLNKRKKKNVKKKPPEQGISV